MPTSVRSLTLAAGPLARPSFRPYRPRITDGFDQHRGMAVDASRDDCVRVLLRSGRVKTG
jgi:hypothetical protein